MQPCSNASLIFWWGPLNRLLYCLGLGANQIKYMDISGVTFDVNGWFNSGNALHALFIYHDVTYEKIIQIDKIFGQFYEIDIQVSYQWYYFRLHSPRLVKQLKKKLYKIQNYIRILGINWEVKVWKEIWISLLNVSERKVYWVKPKGEEFPFQIISTNLPRCSMPLLLNIARQHLISLAMRLPTANINLF